LSPELPGYVDFGGIKRIESPAFAGMMSDVVRDLTELTLLNKNGQTWARVSDMIYCPVDSAVPLLNGNSTATLGKDGYNEWLKASEDLILNIQKPNNGRFVVFSTAESPTYDSAIDTGEVFVARGSLVELVGEPGDMFKVGATSTAGQ
jgi:hypothetical protein